MAYVEILAFIDLESIVSIEGLMEIFNIDRACAEELFNGIIALTEEELKAIAQWNGVDFNDLSIDVHKPINDIKEKKITFTYYGNAHHHK